MHELSTADPSVSILQLNAVRAKHMRAGVIDSTVSSGVCDCVHSVFMGHRDETPCNNRFTQSIIIDRTFFFFPFALCLALKNVFYYGILKGEMQARDDLSFFFFFLLLDRFYFRPHPTALLLCRCVASAACFCLQRRV